MKICNIKNEIESPSQINKFNNKYLILNDKAVHHFKVHYKYYKYIKMCFIS